MTVITEQPVETPVNTSKQMKNDDNKRPINDQSDNISKKQKVDVPKSPKYKGRKTAWDNANRVVTESDGADKTDKLPKRKVALLMGYCGTGYQGMQINPGAVTIESELHSALAKSGAVSVANAYDPSKISFMRAARTDKGVHAAGQVCSLKMICEDPEIVDKINQHLPAQIRVWGYVKVTKNYHAKYQCDSRIYEYILPTYVFQEADPSQYPNSNIASAESKETAVLDEDGKYETTEIKLATKEEMEPKRAFRASKEQLVLLQNILKEYEGSHNYHNFTLGKKFNDKSAMRYIRKFWVSEPFIKDGAEWVSLKVHGQSFMLHQIRKMVGLAIMMIRTKTPIDLVAKTFTNVKLNIPKSPGVGLLLEQTIFDAYNKKVEAAVGDGQKLPVTFEPYTEIMQKFKEEWIYSKQIAEENEKYEFENWLRFIDGHCLEFSWFLTRDGSVDVEKKPAALKDMGRKVMEDDEEIGGED